MFELVTCMLHVQDFVQGKIIHVMNINEHVHDIVYVHVMH